MTRYIQGSDRSQVTLLPECLDDYIDEDNPVRVVDVFVDELDLTGLGFERVTPAITGRPGYHPAVLLKLYIYGYLNRIQSSRRLERESQRNVELMWLTGRLAPDFKTIADFRHDNGVGIRNVCRRFVAMCRQLKLFSQVIVDIDGSKFKAVNNRDKNFTQHKLEQRMKQIDESIERYMSALETADRVQPVQADPVAEAKTQRLKEKITALRQRMQDMREIEVRLKEQPDGQISLTDADARSMVSSRIGTGVVGYNIQAAVDAEHHLVVAHDVVTTGSDRGQLSSMAFKAREATGDQSLQVLADRGYYAGEEIRACEQAGINTFVPKPNTSNSKAQGRYSKLDFIYIAQDNEYLCPAGQRLPYRSSTVEHGMKINAYWTSSCKSCAQMAKCTTGQERRVKRWEHEATLDTMQARLDKDPGAMRLRGSTVEHVFGTIKFWMGSTHLLMKGLTNVRTEISLHCLAYNMRRVMSILGITELINAMRLMRA
jgi:transposase